MIINLIIFTYKQKCIYINCLNLHKRPVKPSKYKHSSCLTKLNTLNNKTFRYASCLSEQKEIMEISAWIQ